MAAAATAIHDSFGVWQRAAMCGTEWDGDNYLRLFPPGRCRRRVAGAEEKGGGNRSGAGAGGQ